MAESGTDWYSWNGNWTLTGTGLVSRIDVIGLVWIRNWNLCFWVGPMWSDSVVDPGLWNGTAWLDSGTFTAWRTPGPSLLGGLRDLDRNWTGESDRCDRTRLDPELELMFLSRTDVVGLSCGSGTFTAWRTPRPLLLGGTGTLTAWRTPLELERSQTILRAAGVVHQLTQASTRMGTFFRRVKHRSSLGHRIDSARKYSLGAETPGPSLLGGTGTLTAWRTLLELERSQTILRAAGVVHQLTQASTRMGTFF